MAELAPLELRRVTLDWSRTYVMGVVNLTPDSFSDGGRFPDDDAALKHALDLVAAGADILDVGAESTRPGAAPVDAHEERRRLAGVLTGLKNSGAIVSVDTYKAETADWALAMELCEIVNDVSGGALDPEILRVVARRGGAIVLGHLRGAPGGDMTARADYRDVVREVREELAERIARAVEAGVPRARILVDPGLGFAKSGAHNLTLLAHLDALGALGCALCVGASRKSFLGALTGRAATERELGTAAADTAAILGGAQVVRVHDVAAQRDAVLVADAIRRAR